MLQISPTLALTFLQQTEAVPAAEEAAGDGTPFLETLGAAAGEIADWFVANEVDGVGLVLVAVFGLLGVWRGLWWQAVRLAGLLGAVLVARAVSPDLSAWIEARWVEVDPLIVSGLAWLVVFLAGLTVAVLLGRLGKRLLEALKLSLWDRLGGLFAGLATGALLHAAGVGVLLQLSPPAWSNQHISGTTSAALVDLLGDRASVLFDSTTALALEARRNGPDTQTPPAGDAAHDPTQSD